jgi:hypothetical protein
MKQYKFCKWRASDDDDDDNNNNSIKVLDSSCKYK